LRLAYNKKVLHGRYSLPRIEVEREEDGRLLASVPELPGVMAYGATEKEAIRKAKAVALQILADMIESGEEVPESLKVLFAA
jgi:predicted RNase H-like HicB family nuclease